MGWLTNLGDYFSKKKYRHTCYILSPLPHPNARHTVIAYLPKEDVVEGRSISIYWRDDRSIRDVELITSKHMYHMDFYEILDNALEDFRENKVKDMSLHEYVRKQLLDFDPASAPVEGETGRVEAEIYVATKRIEFPDCLYDPDDICLSGCVML